MFKTKLSAYVSAAVISCFSLSGCATNTMSNNSSVPEFLAAVERKTDTFDGYTEIISPKIENRVTFVPSDKSFTGVEMVTNPATHYYLVYTKDSKTSKSTGNELRIEITFSSAKDNYQRAKDNKGNSLPVRTLDKSTACNESSCYYVGGSIISMNTSLLERGKTTGLKINLKSDYTGKVFEINLPANYITAHLQAIAGKKITKAKQ